MKVAFVVQRYGLEVNGGSEFLCRLIAERMARHWDLEILTSCAIHYTTWANVYSPGISQVNGIAVRRFNVDFPRTKILFDRISEAVYSEKSTLPLQYQWAREQGPYSSDFLRFLEKNGGDFDLFFFFTYLYGFTFFGLPKVANRSVLISTAHDEPSFHLPIYKALFSRPKGLLFQTKEESDLVMEKYNLSTPHEIVSVGVDDPGDIDCAKFWTHFQGRIKGSYLLYLGRIDESKGCDELFSFFIRYRKNHPFQEIQLILIGKSVMAIPDHPDLCHLGFLDESFKYAALAGAKVLMMPSAYESLSLVTLEAWSVGTPVLMSRKSKVLEGQRIRSNGGLSYESYEEFEDGLHCLLADDGLGKKLGTLGREYVRTNYRWGQVEKSYLGWADRILNRVI